jgi:SHS2 domain-containing protein
MRMNVRGGDDRNQGGGSESQFADTWPRIPPMAWHVLSHTADTGIEATADSLSALLGELSAGMFGLIAPLEPSEAERWIEMSVTASSVDELVVDTLSELLYTAEVEDLIFCAFRISIGPGILSAVVGAGGLPTRLVEPVGPPVKAVTYHDLIVEERDGGWYGRVYFDV